MTPQEQALVNELFDRLATLENNSRDRDAERLITDGLRQAPHAVYALVQTALVQDEALKLANARIEELQAQAGGQEQPRGGSFLDNMRDAVLGRSGPRSSGPSTPSYRPQPGFSAAAPRGTQAEADRLAGVDGDYHVRDLYEAIERGNHPSWTLHMQIMPFDEAKTYRFNPFDLTKVWPHEDYPLIEVGRMTLDRNPTDYHTEIEQAAFEPNNLVPGIGPSPDKMLLARLFSYADAHRARMGVNYKQIPVNQPKVPVHSYSKDGLMRVQTCMDISR